MRFLTILLLIASILTLACTPKAAEPITPPLAEPPAPAPPTEAPNTAALREATRLVSLADKGTILTSDLETLKELTAEDHDAEHELAEIEALIEDKEYFHAAHGLSFLAGAIESGKETICPAHALAHYYVFAKHNRTKMADEALDEAKETMEPWLPAAKAYDAEYPSGQDVDALYARIQAHLDAIAAGNSTASDGEVTFLANYGICVQE